METHKKNDGSGSKGSVSKTHKNPDWFLRYKCGDCKKFGDCDRRIFPNPRSVACEYITK